MAAQARYITSILSVFSTFLESLSVSRNLTLLTTEKFVVFITNKKNLTEWSLTDIEKFITDENVPHKSAVLLRKFISQYTPHEVDVFLHEFLTSLKTDNRSDSTIKNYRSDIQQFIASAQVTQIASLFKPDLVRAFVHEQLKTGLKLSTIRRKLTSISQFATWAESESLVKDAAFWISDVDSFLAQKPIVQSSTSQESSSNSHSVHKTDEQKHKQTKTATDVLEEYLISLEIDSHSDATIRNYKSDLTQFLEFSTGSSLDKVISEKNIQNFVISQRKSGLKTSSIKRKLTSITQFSLWAEKRGSVSNVSLWIHHLPTRLFEPTSTKEHQSQSNKNTELRQLQPEKSHNSTDRISLKLKPQTLVRAHDTKPSKKGWTLPVPDFAQSSTQTHTQEKSQTTQAVEDEQNTKTYAKIRENLAEFAQQLNTQGTKRFLPYFNLVVLFLFVIGLGFLGYQQFIEQAPTPLAYPSTPVRPNRELSFQGRLTDTAQNPITTSTDMAFRLYDTGPGTGGTQLWASGTCSVTPDQDGIFNVGLGDDCGSEITQDVFSENSNVWLEVEIESETLTPRQSIKTVAYALNSETVQGYPIDASGAATANTILTMDSAGNVLLGEVSPTLRSVSGTFAIEAQTLSLQTSAGSNGDIILAPDGTGTVFVQSDLDLEGYLRAPGATFSATYAGGTALVTRGGPSGTANIQEWQNSAGTALSVVDENGNFGIGSTSPAYTLDLVGEFNLTDAIRVAGDAGTSGYLLTSSGGGANTWTDPASLGTNYWDLTANVLHPIDSYAGVVDLALGGTSTSSANIHLQSNGQAFFAGDIEISTDGSNTSNPRRVGFTDLSSGEAMRVTFGDDANALQSQYGGALDLYAFHTIRLMGNRASLSAPSYSFTSNVGVQVINTVAAEAALAIDGASAQTGDLLQLRNNSGTPLTVFDNVGNLGIGSTDPGYALDVVGEFNLTDAIRVAGDAGTSGYFLTSSGGGAMTWTDPSTLSASTLWTNTANVYHPSNEYASVVDLIIGGTATASADIQLYSDGGAVFNEQGNSTNFRVEASGQANALFVQGSNGNVGIGTNAPGAPLDVNGNIYFGSQIVARADTDTRFVFSNNQIELQAGGLRLLTTSQTGAFTGNVTGNLNSHNVDFIWNGDVNGGSFFNLDADVERVGIGTSSPEGKLHVTGPGPGKALTILNETGDQAIFVASDSGVNRFIIQGDGNVGIGTSAPSSIIEALRDQDGVTASRIVNQNTGTSAVARFSAVAETAQLFAFAASDAWTTISEFAGDSGLYTSSGGGNLVLASRAASGGMEFYTGGDSSGNKRMVINSDGNVGIGTDTPAALLQVAGNIFPTADNTYDLGSSSLRWQDLYLGPASLHIGTDGNEGIISYNTTNNYLGFDPDGDATNEFVILDGGNVGINTTTAANFMLEVNGNAGPSVDNSYSLGSSSFRWANIYTAGQLFATGLSDLDNDTKIQVEESADEDSIRFDTAGTERMIIDSAGRIGIGTTSPVHKFEVNSAQTGKALVLLKELGNQDILTASNSAGATRFTMANNGYLYAENFVDISDSTYFLNPAEGGTSLTTAGNAGIGTSNPGARLDVRNASTEDILNLYDGSTEVFTVIDGGNIGIATTSPTFDLEVGAQTTSDTALLALNGGSAIGAGEVAGLRLEQGGTTYGAWRLDASGTMQFQVENAAGALANLDFNTGASNSTIRFLPKATRVLELDTSVITMNIGRGDVYWENNANDNADGAGVTLRTGTNPTNGSIFAVRSSGQAPRLWVGQNFTSSGTNPFYVGSSSSTNASNTALYTTLFNSSGGNSYINSAGGNVSIGTTAAGSEVLFVDGNIQGDNSFLGIGGHGATYMHLSHSSLKSANQYALLQSSGGVTFLNSYNNPLYFTVNNTTWGTLEADGDWDFDANTLFIDTGTNNVGINEGAPADKLEVDGSIRVNGAVANGIKFTTNGDTSADILLTTRGGSGAWTYFRNWADSVYTDIAAGTIYANGNMGVGTSGPAARLHIDSGSNANLAIFEGDAVIALRANETDTGDAPDIVFQNSSGTQLARIWEGAYGIAISNDSSNTPDFEVQNNGFYLANKTDFGLQNDQTNRLLHFTQNWNTADVGWNTLMGGGTGAQPIFYVMNGYTGHAHDEFIVYGNGTTFTRGSHDYAENILTSDLSTEPADIVIVDRDKENELIEHGHNDAVDNASRAPAGMENNGNHDEIIELDEHETIKTTWVKKTNKPYDNTVVGVISTTPGSLLGAWLDEDDFPGQIRPLALAGRTSIKVSTRNGILKRGDAITTSELPGVGMKSTQAGQIVGKVMEEFDPSKLSCTNVSSLEAINWPKDTGSNASNPCFRLPDGTYVGKSIVMVNVTWYDPTVSLASDGKVELAGDVNSGFKIKNDGKTVTSATSLAKAFIANITAGMTNTKELIVKNTATIKNLNVESLKINGQTLASYIQSVVSGQVASNGATLISPIGKDTVITATDSGKIAFKSNQKTLAEISDNGNLSILKELSSESIRTKNLAATGSSTLGALLVSTDATVSGTLHANTIATNTTLTDQLQANTATVSGSLLAGLLETDVARSNTLETNTLVTNQDATVGGTLQTGTLITQHIDAASSRIAALEAGMAQLEKVKATTAELVTATVSGTLYADNIYDFENKIASSLQQPGLLDIILGAGSNQNTTSIEELENLYDTINKSEYNASSGAELDLSFAQISMTSDDVVLTGTTAFIEKYLKVNGAAYVSDSLAVGNSIFVGSATKLADGMIDYTSADPDNQVFQIQPNGKGSIELLAGIVTIDDSGVVTVNGDLEVTGKLKVADSLLTDLLKPGDFGNPLQVQVAGVDTQTNEVKKSRFEIINEIGTPVATFSAQGDAQFAGKVDIAGGLSLASQDLGSSDNNEFNATKTSGKATIKSGSKEVTIKSSIISNDTLIYVTAVGSTNNQVLYVKDQVAENTDTPEQEGKFVVGFDSDAESDVSFNWWIVN